MLNLFGSRQVNDEVFGELEYKRYIFHENFWKGKVFFSPVLQTIAVYIIAGKLGVTHSQRNFFRELERKYTASPELFYKSLCDTFKYFHGEELTEEMLDCKNIADDFELERLLIPSFDASGREWEISYNFKMWNQSYTLYFSDWKFLYGNYDD